MLERLTFDSEAILAFFLGEQGGKVVLNLLEKIQRGDAEGSLNIINLTEIYYILKRLKPESADEKLRNLRFYGITIVPVQDNGLWQEAAEIKAKNRFSIADAFAVATAQAYKSKLVCGGDKELRKLGNVEFLKIRP